MEEVVVFRAKPDRMNNTKDGREGGISTNR